MTTQRCIDAHIHLDSYSEQEQMQIVEQLSECGVDSVIAVSMNLDSCKANLRLHRQSPERVLPAFGYHPERPLPSDEEMDRLIAWIRQHADEMIAVGEVGLPYYARTEAESKQQAFSLEPYIDLLERFVELAAQLDKPIVLHAVYEDADIACDLLERYGVTRAHFHWFKGSLSVLERMMKNGYVVSFTPDVVYDQEIRQIASAVPITRMMVETDGPWPFEGPFKGQMTHPRMISRSIQAIAEIKNMPAEQVADHILRNTREFFGIKLFNLPTET